MTSLLMTSQRPDPLSVRNINFPKAGDHRVKKSPQSDKNSWRRSILKTRTDIQTSGHIDTSTENKGRLELARTRANNVGLISKGAEDVASESPKHRRFSITTLSFDAASPGNHISINLILPETIESLGYIFVADSEGLSSFNFSWWAPH